jgi:PEP-CTERM motif
VFDHFNLMEGKTMRATLVGVFLLCAGSALVRADVIFNDLGPSGSHNNSAAYGIFGSTTLNGSWSMKFTPTITATVSSVSFAVAYFAGTNSVKMELMADNADAPGSVIETYNFVNDPNTTNGQLISANSTSNPTLVAGTSYWFAGLPGGNDTQEDWWENNQGVLGDTASSNADASRSWLVGHGGGLAAFEVLGTPSPAPEPASLCLLGLGTCIMLGRRHRKVRVGATVQN